MLRTQYLAHAAWDRLRLIPRGGPFHPDRTIDQGARCRLAIHLLRLSGATALDPPISPASIGDALPWLVRPGYENNALFAGPAVFSRASLRHVERQDAGVSVCLFWYSRHRVLPRQSAMRLDRPPMHWQPAQGAGEDPDRIKEDSTRARKRVTRPRSSAPPSRAASPSVIRRAMPR